MDVLKRWGLGLLGVAALVAGFLVGWSGCRHVPAPDPSIHPIVTESQPPSAVVARSDGSIKVTLRPGAANQGGARVSVATSQEALHGVFGGSQVSQHPPDFGEIVLEATVSAIATASGGGSLPPEPARLGVIAGPFPGVFAADYQAGKLSLPPAILGTPMDVGVDVELNHLQVGAGLSVGKKLFVTGGGYVTYGLMPGYYLAAGMRF